MSIVTCVTINCHQNESIITGEAGAKTGAQTANANCNCLAPHLIGPKVHFHACNLYNERYGNVVLYARI